MVMFINVGYMLCVSVSGKNGIEIITDMNVGKGATIK